ncbi:MAG TPA: transketolase, partial [Gammaproteobacteria bacterium]|nr:transketolase [Gammaproteobacteria bacterium]
IGFGSPNKEGTAATHGAPLGDEEIAATRLNLDWPHGPFVVPKEIKQAWNATEKGFTAETAWKEKLVMYEEAYPELAMELVRRIKGQLPGHFRDKADEYIASCQAADDNISSRKASQNTIEAYASLLPELIGGSADLTGSNLTNWSGTMPITKQAGGNYIYYGVREFGMTAIASGMALHGGFIPYTATFLIFMEYARNAVRMTALMGQQSIFVYTHDSIGQGEDGPTHQPIEQLANLRSTPNMSVWRPCDNVESAVAWKSSLENHSGPTALVFSRQNLAHQGRSAEQLSNIARGGYILKDCSGEPAVIIIATGSEVEISRQAVETLNEQGVAARLVSMPSVDHFEKQDAQYQESVLPRSVRARLAVEAAGVDYWRKFVGLDGDVVGMKSFGESAPGPVLMEHFGFSAENVTAKAKDLL